MTLHPSSVPQRVVLPSPPASSLPAVADPPPDLTRASSPTVTPFLTTVVTDPTLSSPAVSALVAELVDFATAYRLDYLASLDRQEEQECLAAAAPHLATMLLALEGDPDALDIPTRGSYKEAILVRKTLATLGFAPSTADPSLFLRTDTTMSSFYVLVYINDLVFATADTEALVKAELQERHTSTDLGELRSYLGLQIIRDRARRTITLTQSHMVHQDLQRFGFQFSLPQPTPLSTGHSLSAPPSDESIEPSAAPLPALPCPRRPATARPAACRPAGRRPAARAPPCCPRTALLAAAPPCPAHALPCWLPPYPALAACRSSLVVRRLSLPYALP
ncbi:unnamed protein product [Closterium sp. NIES-54]